MRFVLAIPDPSTMRVGKESYVTLPAGTELHRLHRDRFAPEKFNGTDLGNARFSPIRNAAGAIIPTIYAAESFDCATCEIVLRCPDAPPVVAKTGLPTFQIVFPSDFADYDHSIVRTTGDLTLVDLTIAGQRKLGVNQNALLAGPRRTYPATRAWAEAIHANCPTADGLYYNSFQLGPQFAVVLFGDRLPVGALGPVSSRRVADAPCHGEISLLAKGLLIEYDDV